MIEHLIYSINMGSQFVTLKGVVEYTISDVIKWPYFTFSILPFERIIYNGKIN